MYGPANAIETSNSTTIAIFFAFISQYNLKILFDFKLNKDTQ